jgi:quinol monooxygenase YgiN
MDDAQRQPVVSLVEWPAKDLTLEEAREIAAETGPILRRIPGLIECRFFGDFETGTHYYLQVWESRAALDAFAASESMFRIRRIAAPSVSGRPSRRVLVDYTDPPKPAGA